MSSPIPAMNVTSATQGASGMAPPPVALTERVRAVTKEARDEQVGHEDEQAPVPQGTTVPMMIPSPPFVRHPATSMIGTATSASASAVATTAIQPQAMDGTAVSLSLPKMPQGRLPTEYPPTQRGASGVTDEAGGELRMAVVHMRGPEVHAHAVSVPQGSVQQKSASLQRAASHGATEGIEQQVAPGSRSPASLTGAMSATTSDSVGPSPLAISPQASPQRTPAMQSPGTSAPIATPTPMSTPIATPQASSTQADGDTIGRSLMPGGDVTAAPEARSTRDEAMPPMSAHGLMSPAMRSGQLTFQADAQHRAGQPRPERQLPAAANSQAAVQSTASVTVPFSSWGPGHQVTASWVPGTLPGVAGAGVTLRGSSDRVSSAVGVALEAADPLDTSAWRLQPGNAADDSSGRRTPWHAQPEDDE